MALATADRRECVIPEDGGPQTFEQAVLQILHDWTARGAAMAAPGLLRLFWEHPWDDAVQNMAVSLVAVCQDEIDTKGDRVTPDKLEHFIDTWHAALVAQTVGHTHEEFTRGEHDTDAMLEPILTLPGDQMAEVAEKLVLRLEADERVPFLVWSLFKRLVAPLMINRPAGELLQLKTALATEVAELIEHKLPRQDLVGAMAAALAWRGMEQLTEVKTALEAGGQPRLRGRQSCLFADVEDPAGRVLATVIV